MNHYYNEFDPRAAAWLRELMKAGLIPKGDVDERSIREVKASEVAGYTQCHFFAGIGGWPLALSLAGWPQDRHVWTGSCPCQPFSAAGKRKGAKDPRHLWPWFRHLIFRCRPPVALGEQVASADGRVWLAGVRANLETLGYAVGAADLCAAGCGAPHIRQRLFWVAGSTQHGTPDQVREGQPDARGYSDAGRMADAGHGECGRAGECGPDGDDAAERDQEADQPERHCTAGGLADADGRQPRHQGLQPGGEHGQQPADGGAAGWVGDALRQRRSRGTRQGVNGEAEGDGPRAIATLNDGEVVWSAFDLTPCRDGKARRVEPGTFPLAHGVPARVGRLRGYGNAIVPQIAAEFVRAFMEVE